MAKYAAEGVQVSLVTCTLGEEGEILLPDVAHLAADKEDRLGERRHQELAASMEVLGIADWRLLGGPGRFRDSGMIDTPSNDNPACFWRADLLEAALELVRVIREVRPQVVVTYDDFGGYGHPDHMQANRVTHYAVALASVAGCHPELGEPWQISKLYWTAMSRTMVRTGIKALREAGHTEGFAAMDPDDEMPFTTDDELITTQVDVADFVERKLLALQAHATQITTDSGFHALAGTAGADLFSQEFFRLAAGVPGPLVDGRERDLFAGVDA